MVTKREKVQGKKPAINNQEKKKTLVKTRAGQRANELITKQYEEGWNYVREGKPVAWVMYGPPREIMKTFDVLDIYPEQYAATCSIQRQTSPYVEYAEEDGFSERICGYIRLAMGYARSIARGEQIKDAPFGGMPRPSMLLSSTRMCDPRAKVFESLRRYLDIPAFIFDHQQPPVEEQRCMDKETAERYILHNMEELRGLVKFLEEQTGKKYDRDRLTEMVKNSMEALQLLYDCVELRKNRPCPMGWEDYSVVWRPFVDMAGEAGTVQFYRDMLQEMKERVKLKISVVPEEKYRLMWLGIPMWYDMDLLNYLESLGAVVVAESMWHPTRPVKVDVSDPLRALAEIRYWGWDMYGESDGSQPMCGIASGSNLLKLARDCHVDGVIAHNVISCRSCTIGNRHIAKVFREQMGIPVLAIESHMVNLSAYSPSETRERADTFIHMLEGKR